MKKDKPKAAPRAQKKPRPRLILSEADKVREETEQQEWRDKQQVELVKRRDTLDAAPHTYGAKKKFRLPVWLSRTLGALALAGVPLFYSYFAVKSESQYVGFFVSVPRYLTELLRPAIPASFNSGALFLTVITVYWFILIAIYLHILYAVKKNSLIFTALYFVAIAGAHVLVYFLF